MRSKRKRATCRLGTFPPEKTYLVPTLGKPPMLSGKPLARVWCHQVKMNNSLKPSSNICRVYLLLMPQIYWAFRKGIGFGPSLRNYFQKKTGLFWKLNTVKNFFFNTVVFWFEPLIPKLRWLVFCILLKFGLKKLLYVVSLSYNTTTQRVTFKETYVNPFVFIRCSTHVCGTPVLSPSSEVDR